MSDLNDFFKKKDRKKKKSAKAPVVVRPVEPAAAVEATEAPPPAPKVDDGWIDFDDPKTAQVNTGGRVVGQFKRDADETVGKAGDADAPMEKFTGWTKKDGTEDDGEAEPTEPEKPKIRQAWRPSGPDIKSGAQFPSLADAANAPKVPQSFRSGTAGTKPTTAGGSLSGRPRFVNSNPNKFAGLRKLLEDRDSGS